MVIIPKLTINISLPPLPPAIIEGIERAIAPKLRPRRRPIIENVMIEVEKYINKNPITVRPENR